MPSDAYLHLRCIVALLSLLPFSCTQHQQSRPAMPVWAFCGVDPDDPHAVEKLGTIASAGVDAILGACHRPPADYWVAAPGARYGDPDEYRRLIELASTVGMKVVVFDERIWSDDDSVRARAWNEWAPLAPWIAAWDMGDEFDVGDWPILEHRWQLVLDGVARLGPQPYVNNLPWMLGPAWDLHPQILSYDAYDVPASVRLAGAWSSVHPNLMCAVNALVHGPYTPTATTVKRDMQRHRAAGCDMILLFGGDMPIDTDGFVTPSLVNPDGTPTPLVAAVRAGAA